MGWKIFASQFNPQVNKQRRKKFSDYDSEVVVIILFKFLCKKKINKKKFFFLQLP